MARKSLTISPAGVIEQIGDAEGLLTGSGLDSATAVTLALGEANATKVEIGAADILSEVLGNLTVAGDLLVQGTTTTTESETVLIADSYLNLNDGYQTATFAGGGLVVNVEGTASSDTGAAAGSFTAAVVGVSNAKVDTTAVNTFSQYDIVQISGTEKNDGIYEVESHAANVLTIRGLGITATNYDFFQNNFQAAASAGAVIRKVYISVMRTATSGGEYYWEAASRQDSTVNGSSIDFIRIVQSAGGSITLQEAYEAGSSITTSAAEGNLIITGDQDFQVNGSVDLAFASTGGFVWTSSSSLWNLATTSSWSQQSGAKMSLTSTVNAADAMALTASGANAGIDIIANAGGILLDTDTGTDGPITLDAGTTVSIDGTSISIDGTAASNVSVTGADLNVQTLTSGALSLQSAAALTLTADLGGSAKSLVLQEDGNLVETGIVSINLDPSGAIQLDAGAASNFSVAGAGIDLSLVSDAGRVVVEGGEAAADAVYVHADGVAGGVTVESGTAGIVLFDGISKLELDGAGTLKDSDGAGSNFLVSVDLNPTGAISLDADAASNFSVAGAGVDLTLSSAAGSVIVDGGEADAQAVHLHASNAVGGVLVQSGSAGIDLKDPVATLQLDGSGNLTDAGDVLASIALDPTGAISLDAGASSNFSTDSGNLSLQATDAASLLILDSSGTAANAIDLNATAGGIAADAAGAISLDAALASNFNVAASSASAQNLVIGAANSGAGAANVEVTAKSEIDLTSLLLDFNASSSAAIAIDINASAGGFSIDGVLDSNLTVTGSGQDLDIAVAGGGAQELRLASAGTGEFGGTPALQIAATAGGFGLAGVGDSVVQVVASGKDLNLLASGGGAQQVKIASAGTGADAIFMEMTAGGLDVNAFGNINLQAGVSSGTGTLTMSADSTVLLESTGDGSQTVTVKSPLNGSVILDVGGSSQLIMGKDSAKLGDTSASKPMPFMLAGFDSTTNSLAAGDVAYISAANQLQKADANTIGTARVAGVVGANGHLVAYGVVDAAFEDGLGTLSPGSAVYLSASTAGYLTDVAPSAGGDVVAEVGIVVDGSAYVDATPGSKALILLQVKSPVVL